MRLSKYTIHELCNLEDPRPWKLHWFEELTWNQVTTEPLVEALFVPLIHADLNLEENPPELLDNASYDFTQARKIDVGGGLLSMLHIGLMFFQGRPIKRPRYQRKIFNLFIGADTTDILPIKHGSRPAHHREKIYDVPYSQYYLGGTNDYVRCLHVNVPPGRRDKISKVIIPSVELIRCHFGNSSQLFHEVLRNGLAGSPNRVFDPSRTILPNNPLGVTPFLQLSPYVKRQDAPIVARFAFDPYALACARQIYLSAQRNAKRPYRGRGIELQGYVPEVCLPYINQQTRMVVHGKEIISGENKYFLVFYIESDSSTFPFQYFEFGQDGSDRVHVVTDRNLPDAGRSVPVKEKGEEYVTVNNEVEEFVLRGDKEPSAIKKEIEELLWTDKFPDLKKKNWCKRDDRGYSRIRPPRHKPKFIQGHDDTEELSTAPRGSGENKVTPVSLIFDFEGMGTAAGTEDAPNSEEIPVDEEPKETTTGQAINHGEALPASYGLFKQLVHMLNKVLPDKLECHFVRVPKTGEEKTFGQPLVSVFPTEWHGQRLPWSTVTRDGERRERRVAIARGVCHAHHYFYLLEIEPPERNLEKEREAKRQGRKPWKPRTYTLLAIHYTEQYSFADTRCENLREVMATCAQNKGSWLDDEQLEHFGRYKFKHASKFETVFVARIIEYLLDVGLLRLEEAEAAEVLGRLRSEKTDEPLQTGKQEQSEEQSQPAEPVVTIASAEHSDSPQLSVADEAPQSEELVIAEEAVEAPVSSDVNEASESDRSSETEESEVLVLV